MRGQSYPLPSVALRPDQGLKLDLRKELKALGLDGAEAGGLELSYEGPGDALKAHGVLFDKKGFSAEIDFTRYARWDESQALTLRTPRFAVGKADPQLGLPAPTVFEPTVALHNFNSRPLEVALVAGYTQGDIPQEVTIPVVLPAGDTRVVSLHPYLRDAIPANVSWASLEVRYTDNHTGLAATMVSVSQDGEHSIRSVLNWVDGSTREGWYWRVDTDNNTLINTLNTDTEEARLAISLDYYVGGVKHTYQLPEQLLPPRSTAAVDIGQLVASGRPDVNGNVLPAEGAIGGYQVRKVGPRIHTTVTTEALVFNRRTKNYLTFYNTCCGYDKTRLIPSLFIGPVGPIGIAAVEGHDYCSQQWVELTFSSQFGSTPTSVATVGATNGNITGVAPGTAAINTLLNYPKQKTVDTCITGNIN